MVPSMPREATDPRKGAGRIPAPVLFAIAFFAVALLSGCVANDMNEMPWAAPDPNEASINLPGQFSRP